MPPHPAASHARRRRSPGKLQSERAPAAGAEPGEWTTAPPRLGWCCCGPWGCSPTAALRIWVGGLRCEPAGSAWGAAEGREAVRAGREPVRRALPPQTQEFPSPLLSLPHPRKHGLASIVRNLGGGGGVGGIAF